MLCYLIPAQVQAADSEVTWVEPANYRDIHQGADNRKRFHKKMYKNFDEHFDKLAQEMPKNYTLKVNVTDVDLAGNIYRAGMKWGSQLKMIRKIDSRSLDAPRMELSFELLDENKTVILSGKNSLKRTVNKIKGSVRDRTRNFSYEKKMIDDWFEGTFVDFLMK